MQASRMYHVNLHSRFTVDSVRVTGSEEWEIPQVIPELEEKKKKNRRYEKRNDISGKRQIVISYSDPNLKNQDIFRSVGVPGRCRYVPEVGARERHGVNGRSKSCGLPEMGVNLESGAPIYVDKYFCNFSPQRL